MTAFKLLSAIPYGNRPQPANVVACDLKWVRKALQYGETFADIEAALRGLALIWPQKKSDWWRPALVFGKKMGEPGYPFYVRCREAWYKRGMQRNAGDVAKRIAKAIYG